VALALLVALGFPVVIDGVAMRRRMRRQRAALAEEDALRRADNGSAAAGRLAYSRPGGSDDRETMA
jgi:predicted kinase